tara:strand:- start:211 stop:399 length:189 start_codon:yes stop_codon:yes gene_type:complete
MNNIKFHTSATTKCTSMSGGNQNGWKTDQSNAPSLNLKFNNNKFKQVRNIWKERKSLGLKCT